MLPTGSLSLWEREFAGGILLLSTDRSHVSSLTRRTQLAKWSREATCQGVVQGRHTARAGPTRLRTLKLSARQARSVMVQIAPTSPATSLAMMSSTSSASIGLCASTFSSAPW